jgi:DNA-directed RNA polymerase specialized sigma24 family protein
LTNIVETLERLSIADGPARSEAERSFYEHYFSRLAAAVRIFALDEDCAVSGAGEALMEFMKHRRQHAQVKSEDRVWSWLLRRARDRARDYWRRQRAVLADLPKTYFEDHQITRVPRPQIEDGTSSPLVRAIGADRSTYIHERLLRFLNSLKKPVDRALLLHDMEVRYQVLSAVECEEIDAEFRSRYASLPTSEAMKKRRQRLGRRLARLMDGLR